MKKFSIIAIALVILVVIAGILFVLRSDTGSGHALKASGSGTEGLMQTYSDPDLGFSFKYPERFDAQASGGVSNRLILVSLPSQDQEFQLYVTPFGDVPASVTADRIKNDVPGIDMRDAEAVSVPGGGQGVSFLSTISGVKGDVREIWFALDGHLFQWSAPAGSETAMRAAISAISLSDHE